MSWNGRPLTQARHNLPPQEGLHAFAGQFVGALVLVVAGMALDPVPLHLVTQAGGVEALPQLDVLDGLAVGGLPAVLLPAVNPLADAVLHVLGVGVQVDVRGALERLQRRDGGEQLHAVVGGLRLAALQLLAVLAGDENGAPAAGPRISRAGAVGVDDDGRLGRRSWAGLPAVVGGRAHAAVELEAAQVFERVVRFHQGVLGRVQPVVGARQQEAQRLE